MSQTVEFEYGIGETVRIKSHTMPGQKCEQLATVVAQQRSRNGQQWFSVEWDEGHGIENHRLMADFLTKIPVPEPEFPAPTFPRVIWQGEVASYVYRIVQTSSDRCVAETRISGDAMGGENWKARAWDGDWLEDVVLELHAQMEPDGSPQNT